MWNNLIKIKLIKNWSDLGIQFKEGDIYFVELYDKYFFRLGIYLIPINICKIMETSAQINPTLY